MDNATRIMIDSMKFAEAMEREEAHMKRTFATRKRWLKTESRRRETVHRGVSRKNIWSPVTSFTTSYAEAKHYAGRKGRVVSGTLRKTRKDQRDIVSIKKEFPGANVPYRYVKKSERTRFRANRSEAIRKAWATRKKKYGKSGRKSRGPRSRKKR
jgi:hypothetical protein